MFFHSFGLSLTVLLLPLSRGCPYLRRVDDDDKSGDVDQRRNLQDNGVSGAAGKTIQDLLDNHDKIVREVTNHADSTITTKTYSSDSTVGGWLQDHVATMKSRVEAGQPVRSWDPFFVALIDHRKEWDAKVSKITNGVKVEMSASTDCGQDLIEGHTEVVSLFVSTGRKEAGQSHDAPSSCGGSSRGGGGSSSSSGGGSSSGVSCFSGNAHVQVRDGGPTAMQELRVGDFVLTGKQTYERVYSFAHLNKERPTAFVKIHTAGDRHPLELTGDHLLFVDGKSHPRRADSIQVGDALQGQDGPAHVSKVSRVRRTGIYAPLTKDGTIVVDGIVASCYADILGGSTKRALVMTQQSYIHRALSPFRLLCSVSGDLCNKSYNDDGMPYYVAFGIWLTNIAEVLCATSCVDVESCD